MLRLLVSFTFADVGQRPPGSSIWAVDLIHRAFEFSVKGEVTCRRSKRPRQIHGSSGCFKVRGEARINQISLLRRPQYAAAAQRGQASEIHRKDETRGKHSFQQTFNLISAMSTSIISTGKFKANFPSSLTPRAEPATSCTTSLTSPTKYAASHNSSSVDKASGPL